MHTEFTPLTALAGGALIGLAAVVLLLANGRIAGVSGIAAGLFTLQRGEFGWRAAFIAGLWIGATAYVVLSGGQLRVELAASTPLMIGAGLLVGFGTRMAGGCTSGHGVCGIARFSRRSLVATAVFMASGFATVFVTRHLLSL